MGELRKKFTFSKVALLCFATLISFLTFAMGTVWTAGLPLVVNAADIPELDWVEIAAGNVTGLDVDYGSQTFRIREGVELARVNYLIKTGDWSGWTILLIDDLEMGGYVTNQGGAKVTPYWTPIPTAGKNNAGKTINTNIKFDGAGHRIKNLKIRLTDVPDGESNVAVGFFGKLVDGAVENVIFENPTLEYGYNCQDKAANVLTQSVEVAVGIVAGVAEGAEIRDVTIEKPNVLLTADNVSGHQFCVGGAVGKLTDRYYNIENTVYLADKPDMGVIDAVTINGGTVSMKVNNSRAGTATQGNLGGVVGVNYSGKVINSKVKGVNITASLNNAAGKYYHGGLVGQSALRVRRESDILVSGLLNNIIMSDVTVTGDNATSYTGAIAGWVCGNWVHSNFYFSTKNYNADAEKNLFGCGVNNEKLYYYPENCVGYYDRDALVDSFFSHDGFACGDGVFLPDEGRYLCTVGDHNNASNVFGAVANSMNLQITQTGQFSDNYIRNNSLNEFDESKSYGQLTQMAKEIVKYDYGNNADFYREAVNQFRIWQVVDGEACFGRPLGEEFSVVYHASGKDGYKAGWIIKNDNSGHDDEDDEDYEDNQENDEDDDDDYRDAVDTLIKKYVYKEEIDPLVGDDLPKLKGYRFTGWFENPDEQTGTPYFGTDANPIKRTMGSGTIHLYATWWVESYDVNYYVDGVVKKNYSQTDVPYNTLVRDPATLSNYSAPTANSMEFVGWFTKDGFSGNKLAAEDDETYWDFSRNKMPARTLNLYAGWYHYYEDLENKRDEVWNKYLKNNEDEEYYTYVTYAKLRQAHEYATRKINNPDSITFTADQLLQELNDAIDGLRVDVSQLRDHEAINKSTSGNLRENKYPFLYTAESYETYRLSKQLAESYIQIFEKDPKAAGNVDEFKSVYFNFIEAFDGLVRNTYLGGSETLIDQLIDEYEAIKVSANNYYEPDYDAALWSDFVKARESFEAEFSKSNPRYGDLQAAIDNLKHAELVLQGGVVDPDTGSQANEGAKKSLPFLLIGIIVCVVIVLGAGGFIGFDIYKHTDRKPKVRTVNNTQQVQQTQPVQAQQPSPVQPQPSQANIIEDDEDDDDSEYV